MTNRLAVICILALGLTAHAETLKLDTLKIGSTTYSNVTILGANATDLYFRHSLGFGNVKLLENSRGLSSRRFRRPGARH